MRFARDQADFRRAINTDEVVRLNGNLHSFDEGDEFKDEQHDYSNDLDVFGRNSLFQLLSRATTPSGRSVLAEWLLKPASTSEIKARQKACQELSEKIDWRQEFQALGMHEKNAKQDFKKLIDWVNRSEPNDHVFFLKALGIVLPLLSSMLLVLNLTIGISIYFFLGMLAINGLVVKQFLKQVLDITMDTNTNVSLLKSYSRLIAHIENSDFSSPYLQDRKKYFFSEGYSAAHAILTLQRFLDFLNSRANMLYGFMNLTFLMDIHLVLGARKWKQKNAAHVTKWFDAIGEIEAVSSLAAYAFANESYTYPELSKREGVYEARNLGHPLIFSEERVSNDFSLDGVGNVAIITGSNMSGKSTFLRTLGVNAVLAFAGAPCCASEISLSSFQLFTSMRTQDNLEEHVSSFYAELKRLKQLLERIKKNTAPVFFLLDEILKGTNSKDRHLGSASLVKQLSGEMAFGLVSTHDLELGGLAHSMSSVVNYSFNSEINGNEISFDYKLTYGICKSFNASKLMENMGINILKHE
ncbi:MAG: DNA mismatch repair protein MutS [Bacteroidota bacterium]